MGKAIGIDFGTTNTVVSYLNKNNKLRQLKYNGNALIPTCIYFLTRDDYVIGHGALNRMISSNDAGIASFKTKLGEKGFFYEVKPEKDRPFKILPRVAANYFLNKIAGEVEGMLIREFGPEEGIVDKMVITVPAKFNPVEKEAIRKAAASALGQTDTRRIALALEPTAAAIAAMGEDAGNAASSLLVYDFGGGTFDVSLIKKERGVFRQLDKDGDKYLGGNTLTIKVLAELLKRVNEEYGTEFPLDENEFDETLHGISRLDYTKNMAALWQTANKVKEDLSSYQETDAQCNIVYEKGANAMFSTCVERQKLEFLLGPEIEKTANITASLYNGADEKPECLVLAGGSSRIPLIHELLEQRLPDVNIAASDNVSTIISRGAALLAQNIDSLEAVTDQGTAARYGVSATEGLQFNKFQMLIPENTPLPCEASRDFRLGADNQRRLDIRYYEHDVNKNPGAVFVTDEGMQEVDTLHICLPEGLRKDDTIITVRFQAKKDGGMDIAASIKTASGIVETGSLHVARESELE